jgi:hypothetical protein
MKNKNIRTKRRSLNKILIVLLVLSLLSTGAYLLLVKDNSVEVSQEQQEAAERLDSERAKQEAEEARNSVSDPLKDVEDPGDEEAEGAFTLGSPSFEQSGGMVSSSVAINGIGNGRCEFIFSTPQDRPVSRTVEVASGTCSASIPEVEFAKLGEWNLAVNFGGKSVSRKVNIN